MVNLTKIYTRTGDDGTTSLGDFSRTSKNDPRLVAYADTNEANALVGVAVAAGGLGDEVTATLTRVQNELFDVGADLCTPLQPSDRSRGDAERSDEAAKEYPPLRVEQPWVDDLEADCDRYLERIEPLRSFILPGGTVGAAHLHVATTVVRRAERSAWAAITAHGEEPGAERGVGGVNRLTATYLNRLSDLLFILARVANVERGGDVLWRPGGGRVEPPTRRRRGQNRVDDQATLAADPGGEASAQDRSAV
jgi:cob(I)alamin adenosyltransferase